MATKMLWVRNGETGYSENGNPYAVRVLEERAVAIFKPISSELTVKLLDFAKNSNIGKTVVVDGVEYKLDYISCKRRSFGRSLSVYFLVGRSVIRISDHWSRTNNHGRSKKLNCGQIDSAWWELEDTNKETVKFKGLNCGDFPWVVKAGVCGKSVLNKTVSHWV